MLNLEKLVGDTVLKRVSHRSVFDNGDEKIGYMDEWLIPICDLVVVTSVPA